MLKMLQFIVTDWTVTKAESNHNQKSEVKAKSTYRDSLSVR